MRRSRAGDEAAKERGCYLEINGHPSRLDLDDVHCRAAKEMGLKLAISTDAHSTMVLTPCAMAWTRRGAAGWSRTDILNARKWPN